MQLKRLLITAAIFGLAGVGAANATCTGLAGTWYFYALEVRSPGIKTHFENVITQVSPQKNKNIETFTFTNTDQGYNNGVGDAIQCTVKVAANGSLKSVSPCTTYHTVGNPDSNDITGQLSVSSCNLTGTINAETPVTITSGRISGTVGTGIATQAGGRVMHFTLSK